MKTKTPRTDALEREMGEGWGGAIEPLALCRELERQNARLKARSDHWQARSDTAEDENALLREVLTEMSDTIRAMKFVDAFPKITQTLKSADDILSNDKMRNITLR